MPWIILSDEFMKHLIWGSRNENHCSFLTWKYSWLWSLGIRLLICLMPFQCEFHAFPWMPYLYLQAGRFQLGSLFRIAKGGSLCKMRWDWVLLLKRPYQWQGKRTVVLWLFLFLNTIHWSCIPLTCLLLLTPWHVCGLSFWRKKRILLRLLNYL